MCYILKALIVYFLARINYVISTSHHTHTYILHQHPFPWEVFPNDYDFYDRASALLLDYSLHRNVICPDYTVEDILLSLHSKKFFAQIRGECTSFVDGKFDTFPKSYT